MEMERNLYGNISNAMRRIIDCLDGLLKLTEEHEGKTRDLLVAKPPIGCDPTVTNHCFMAKSSKAYNFREAFETALHNLTICQKLLEEIADEQRQHEEKFSTKPLRKGKAKA
jgi:hypothetical protein